MAPRTETTDLMKKKRTVRLHAGTTGRSNQKNGEGEGGRRCMRGGQNATTPPKAANDVSKNNSNNNAFLSNRRISNANVRQKLSNSTVRALSNTSRGDAPIERLTKVQAATLEPLLSGQDVFVKSKTGSGKTMAFLIPAVERSLQAISSMRSSSSSSSSSSAQGTASIHGTAPLQGTASIHGTASLQGTAPLQGVVCLVVSPTKDLAMQTFRVAERLLRDNEHGLSPVLLIGGMDRRQDERTLQMSRPKLIVATPGRLKDHLNTKTNQVQDRVHAENVRAMFTDLVVVVLDEADRMLDSGFVREVEYILSALPSNRQTVMVSATISQSVRKLAGGFMKKDERGQVRVLNVAGSDDDNDDDAPRVSSNVQHRAMVVSHDEMFHALVGAICRHASDKGDFKIMVFLPVVKYVILMAALLREYFKTGDACLPHQDSSSSVLEIHSSMSQNERNQVMDAFRAGNRKILLGSDVVSRGVDFPHVSFVIQVGVTEHDTYVHRVGRTGRAVEKGQALLLLTEFEAGPVQRILSNLNVEWLNKPAGGVPKMPGAEQAMQAMYLNRRDMYEAAYGPWVGTYKSKLPKLKGVLEQEGKKALAGLGMQHPSELKLSGKGASPRRGSHGSHGFQRSHRFQRGGSGSGAASPARPTPVSGIPIPSSFGSKSWKTEEEGDGNKSDRQSRTRTVNGKNLKTTRQKGGERKEMKSKSISPARRRSRSTTPKSTPRRPGSPKKSARTKGSGQ